MKIKTMKIKTTMKKAVTCFILLLTPLLNFAQILANYNFNSGISYGTLNPQNSNGALSTMASTGGSDAPTGGSTLPFVFGHGTITTSAAFVQNLVAGKSLLATGNLVNNTNYWQWNIDGNFFCGGCYQNYVLKVYLQYLSTPSGPNSITLKYTQDAQYWYAEAPTPIIRDGNWHELILTVPFMDANSEIWNGMDFTITPTGAIDNRGAFCIDNVQIKATQTNAYWRQVSAGYNHGVGFLNDGSLYAWGDNQNGELGNGFVGVNYFDPVLVSPL
ncbi:MAG TPA: hypothetical protein VNX68_14715, partial [Nitrosopumilaceae archaeon]|nr:hypothetical protein [Nitrosopumilaceae archaeon]